MKCSKCGMQLKSDANFCKNCGNKVAESNFVTEKIICDMCGRSLKKGDRFCRFCGNGIKESDFSAEKSKIICPSCGGKVKMNAVFCSLCGVDLNKIIEKTQMHEKKSSGKALFTVIIVLLVMAIFLISIIVGYFSMGLMPE